MCNASRRTSPHGVAGLAAVVLALALCPGLRAAHAAPAAPTQDDPPPELRLLNFHRGVYAGGSRLYVFWKSAHIPKGPKGLALDISRDGGKTWKEVAAGIPDTGRYLWTLPREEGRTLRLRLRWSGEGGVTVSSVSAEDFGIDSEAPEVRAYCREAGEVHVSVDEETAQLRFQLPEDPGPATVTLLEVHVSTDGGATWKAAGKGSPADPSIPLLLSPGENGVVVVAQDAAGNKGEPPFEGKKPDLLIQWNATEELAAGRFRGVEEGKTYPGKTKVEFRWNPPREVRGVSARIEIRVEGSAKWEEIAVDLPVSGTREIELPAVNSKQTGIRLVIVGDDKLPKWVKPIGPFAIGTPPPGAKIKGVEEEKEGAEKDGGESDGEGEDESEEDDGGAEEEEETGKGDGSTGGSEEPPG